MKLKELMEEPNLFERKRSDWKRIFGIATYVQTSSTRRTVKTISKFRQISHTAVWKWIKKFEEKVPISTEKKFYVFSDVGVERNELVLMKAYTTRNYLTAKPFIKEVLKYCENEPKFVIDKAPRLRRALESLGVEFKHEKFRKKKFG